MRLDSATLETGCRILAERSAALAALYDRNGLPPLWRRQPGFSTLVKLILEQQVSLASGAAAYRRLEARLGEVTPATLLTLDDDELRAAAFSRQKARYVRLLAGAILAERVDLEAIGRMDDDDATAALTAQVGIGPWTAANYLLFALGRPDAWPRGDRALVVALARAIDRPEPPSYEEADEMAETWRPWRAVAARLLWHDYLGGRNYDPASFS